MDLQLKDKAVLVLASSDGLGKATAMEFCREGAMNILKTLESKYVDWDPQTDFLVKSGAVEYHERQEHLHVPLIYGDYYFLESVYRLCHPELEIW